MTRVVLDASAQDGRPSGARTRTRALADALRRRGDDVVIWTGPYPVLSAWQRYREGASRLQKMIDETRPDLIITEALPWMGPHGVPFILTVHDLRRTLRPSATGWLWRRWFWAAASRARAIHVPTRAVADALKQQFPRCPCPIHVVPNVVTLKSLPELRARDFPELPSRFVVSIGHPEARKDWDLVRDVAKSLPPLTAWVRVGRGVLPGPWVDLGEVSDEVRDSLLAKASAVVCPSRLEGFGLVPLEALALGAWVVASEIPAHREVLGNAATYFPVGDVASARARVLEALSANAMEQAAKGLAARQQAKLFSEDALDRALALAFA